MLLTGSLSVPDPGLNCTQYGENQTACCERPSCAFVNCTVNKTTEETHKGQGRVQGHKMTYKNVNFGQPMFAS